MAAAARLHHAAQRACGVEFKPDVLNQTSRAALARVGARQEGIFRHYMITYTGRSRDSVYFSISDDEWPQVKRALEEKLAQAKPQERAAP